MRKILKDDTREQFASNEKSYFEDIDGKCKFKIFIDEFYLIS